MSTSHFSSPILQSLTIATSSPFPSGWITQGGKWFESVLLVSNILFQTLFAISRCCPTMPVYCYDRDHLEVLTIVRTNTDQCNQHHHHRIYRQRKCHTNINLVSCRWFTTPELETCSVLPARFATRTCFSTSWINVTSPHALTGIE